ncbi:MAG: hypothetical protein QXU98_11445, partial [Candidatus Parvarchaeota archaeon]
VIYDNTTKNYVSQYDSFKTIVSGPQTATLNGQDNYTIYALYFVPINVTTDFLNEPQAFGTYFSWQTFPYNITNVVNNTGISVNKATNTYFSLPTEASNYIPNYAPQQVTIQEGYYNANKQFTSTTMTISDYNNITNCYAGNPYSAGGQVGQCLVEGPITGVTSTFTTSSSNLISTSFGNYTFTHDGYCNTISGWCTKLYQTFAYSPSSIGSVTIVAYDVYRQITSNANLDITNPLNIVLNYGYIIPVFLSYNTNMSGTVSSCQELESIEYPNLYGYLIPTKNPFICSGFLGVFNTKEYVAESYYDNAYVYNVSSAFYIYDKFYYVSLFGNGLESSFNNGLSDEYNQTCNPMCSNYQFVRYYNSTITGFGSSPIVNDEGSSQESSISPNIYEIQTTSYPSASTINGYAFYERTS